MKILFVVQAYGTEVSGGAETHCRLLATRLAANGNEVVVATSCARTYSTWANEYPLGETELDGVRVVRFPVRGERNSEIFAPLDGRVVWGRRPVPAHLQNEWLRLQGPEVEGFESWLNTNGENFDLVFVMTYLYSTSFDAVKTLAGRVPLVIQPLAHDEPQLKLPIFRSMMNLVDGIVFNTPEEGDLVRSVFHSVQPSATIGVGTNFEVKGDAQEFRNSFGIADEPYLLFIGRVDPHKGSEELYEYFLKFKELNPQSNLKLVVVGEQVKPLTPHRDVVLTGFVDEQTKFDALSGATALVVPSYFESFSMVLTEAWSLSIPAIVQGRCAVLVGQATRSNGAIPYNGFGDFAEAVKMISDSPELAGKIGQAGLGYTKENYDWDVVISRYEKFLAEIVAGFSREHEAAKGKKRGISARHPESSTSV